MGARTYSMGGISLRSVGERPRTLLSSSLRESSSIETRYCEYVLWGDIQLGDVVFARSGPWLVTSVAHGDEFGFLLLDCGETGVYESKAHSIVQSPIMRKSTLLNHHGEVLW